MKSVLFFILCSTISLLSFAQTPFTEATLLSMNQRMLADYTKFFAEEVSPDLTVIFGEGQTATYANMKESNTTKIAEWTMSELKVRQIGKTAIATGINKHTVVVVKTNTSSNYNVRFTYIYEYKNNKWMWIHGQHTHLYPSKSIDEEAIKKVIEASRVAFHTGNSTDLLKIWKDDPKTYHIGIAHNYENAGLRKGLANIKPSGKTAAISNYRIKINGNTANADIDQVNTNANGSKETEHAFINLEKNNGDWQITGTSIIPTFINTLENEEAIKKVIDDETMTFHINPQEVTKYWKLDDKTFMMGTWDNGKFTMFDAEKLKAALKAITPQNGKGVKSNHRINIKGNIAIVDFDQVTTAPDGSKSYQHNLCLLEKTNGEWKFIGSSIYKTTGL